MPLKPGRALAAGFFKDAVSIKAGESKVLSDLYRVCPIVTEGIVQVKLYAEDGSLISSSDTLVDLERHQSFPRAELSLKIEGGKLIVSSDKAIRSTEKSLFQKNKIGFFLDKLTLL
ncbi:MAG: hypothetical protein ACYDG2_01460 [Ruminiclostridium sp.]